MAVFVCLSGLPGVGKSTVSEELSRQTGALWLRVDAIEQAMRGSSAAPDDLEGMGYHALCGAAEGALAQGFDVIADSVNPIAASRVIYHEMTERAGVRHLDVVVECSNRVIHRARVEGRGPSVPGLKLPDWAAVEARAWEPLEDAALGIDTAVLSARDAARAIAELMEDRDG